MGQPGSGALNAGYAVTYGDLGETNRMNLVNLLRQQNQAEQDKIEAQRQADIAHRYALQKYYGKDFDPSNFDTQTDFDKTINEKAGEYRKGLTDLLNNNASQEDIDNYVNSSVGDLQKLSDMGNLVKRNIEASTEGLKGDKGIDLGALKKHAFLQALYTKDPQTDAVRLKTPQELSQLDPEQNYAQDILQNHPEWVAKGDIDYNGILKSLPVANFKSSGEYYSEPGVKRKGSFDAQYYDGAQKLVRDKNGVYGVQTADNPIETKDANGKPIVIHQIPENVINSMEATPGGKAKLDVATMQYLKNHPEDAQAAPGTPAFEIAKRAMVYDAFEKTAPKRIGEVKGVTMAAPVIRMQLGLNGKGEDQNKGEDVRASFNDINDVPFVGDNGVQGKIKNGTFEQAKMNKFFGTSYKGGEIEGTIPLNSLPSSVFAAVNKFFPKNDITGEKDKNDEPTGNVRVKITDGKISAIKTDKGWFDVNDRENSNIKLQNSTVPLKNKKQYKLPDAKKTASDYGL